MIPNTVHLVHFGPRPLSDLNRRCIASAKEKLPGWTVKLWRDAAGRACPWVRNALDQRQYCSASNYFRIWILNAEGGVYIDTDVEVLKPFDLNHNCFLGFSRQDTKQDCITTAVIGAVPGHWFLKSLLQRYQPLSPVNTQTYLPNTVTTELLYAAGMEGLNVNQMVSDIRIYSRDYLYPLDWIDRSFNAENENTICRHHLAGSWKGE